VRKSAAVAGVRCGLTNEISDGVAWLTLDRPAAGNRVTEALAQALCDAAAAIELDDTVSVVVLAGSGASFCLGVEEGRPHTAKWHRHIDWVDAIARLSRPVVAVVHGDAFDEGLELALACDLRVASSRARFRMAQLGDGRLPSHGGTQRLPRLVGRMRALDMLLTGCTIDAASAEAMGLVSRMAPASRFASVRDALVADLRSKGPVALRYAKEAVLKGTDLTLDQGIRLEEDLYVLLQTTHDRQEGVRAFLEKRRPMFRGK